MLTHFMPPFPFCTPWKFQTLSFLMFSRIQKDNSGMEWVKNKFHNAEADDVLTNRQLQNSWRKTWILTHLFPMQPFSSPGKHKVFWCFQGGRKDPLGVNRLPKYQEWFTSFWGTFANGVATTDIGIPLSFNISWLHGTEYTVDRMKRGLQFPMRKFIQKHKTFLKVKPFKNLIIK